MSIDVMKLVWDKSRHKETNLLALLALADMANSDGHCWPSHETLANRCRCSRRNMVYVIEKLEASGELYVEHSRGRNNSNRYLITIDSNVDTLAGNLIKYFGMSAADATEIANDHIAKCATEAHNVKPTAHFENVKPTAHLTPENVKPGAQNVKPGALKCEAGFTRSQIDPSIEPSLNTATQSAHKAQRKNSVDETSNTTKGILDAYVEVRGKNGINYGKEGKAAKRIAAEGGTPELVKGCYGWMKQDKFWQHKPLGLSIIHEHLPEYQRYLERTAATAKTKIVNGRETLPDGFKVVPMYGPESETL